MVLVSWPVPVNPSSGVVADLGTEASNDPPARSTWISTRTDSGSAPRVSLNVTSCARSSPRMRCASRSSASVLDLGADQTPDFLQRRGAELVLALVDEIDAFDGVAGIDVEVGGLFLDRRKLLTGVRD